MATWVFRQGEPAGRHTATLPAASLPYLPLRTPRLVVGVLGVTLPAAPFAVEQRRLLEAFANQGALAIERTLGTGRAT